MEKALAAYLAWKQADQEARAVEMKLAALWEDVVTKSGAPPSKELLAEVSRLRGIANEKLTASIRAMNSDG